MTLYLIAGLAIGAIYALIALGFVVIYRSSQVFNFAQGELVMLGAYLMATFADIMAWPFALLAAVLGTGIVALAIERTVLRKLVGRPVYVSIILTIIVGSVIRIAVLLIWGTGTRGMPTPWDPLADGVFGISVNNLAALLATGVALGGYFLLIRYTKFGLAMRASSSDQEAALSLGIPVGRVFAGTWFMAGVFAALAGVFLAMFPRSVDPNLGLIALAAFPAVIVGGLDSALGTVIAALVLGVLQVLTEAYLNPLLGGFGQNFHAVFPYIVMIGFLLVRPYGLFGTEEVQRV